MLKLGRDFEAEDWSVFCCRCLVEVVKMSLGEILRLGLIKILKLKFTYVVKMLM